jgi:hypothetical protein
MRSSFAFVGIASTLALLSRTGTAVEKAEPQARAGMAVWDTGRPSAESLLPEAISAKTGWSQIQPDQKPPASFTGDAVATNGRILVVIRKQGAAVEVHSGGEVAAPRVRCVLQAAGGEPAARLIRVALVENTKGVVCLEASFQTTKGTGLAARFRIKKGDVALETVPGAGASGLRVECPGRFAMLPDFFADDIVIDAAKIPLAAVEVPSENFVLHMAGNGEAIAMCVFENRDQDVRLTLSGDGEKRVVTGSEIRFGKDRKIWIGLLEAPQIWHVAAKAGDTGKVSRMDWKIPFRAQWRVDFHRTDDLIDSSTLLLQEKKDGDYLKPTLTGDVHSGWAPQKITPEQVRKGYYPAWSDPEGQVYLMPSDWPAVLRGPVILFPMNRVAETPPDLFTVVDLARNCLGAGPCDYILDLEGHKDQYKGRATCGVRDILGRIYSNKQQKEKHDDVEKCLKDGLTFVTHIRSRVAAYLEFANKTKQYLAEQGKAHAELKGSIGGLEKILQEMDACVAARQGKIKTPADVAEMNEQFRKDVLDYEGPDALEKCKKYTSALVEIGGNQDELVAECRRVVKALRQRAGIVMAMEPGMAAVAGEIRTRTQEVLRNPAWHEGANK